MMTTSKRNSKASSKSNDDGWSKPHCGLSHKVVGAIQLTIMILPGAVVAMALTSPVQRKVFMKKAYEDATQAAKEWLEQLLYE